MSGLPQLPQGWVASTLGAIGHYYNGRAFKESDWLSSGRPIIRIQNLTSPDKPFNYFQGEVDERNVVRDGDLLVSWAATLDVFRWSGPEAVLNQHIFKVESFINPAYHYYLLKSVLDDLRRQAHGATMVHVTRDRFDATPVVLPPLPEQARIVKAIDRLSEQISSALDEVRQSEILVEAFRFSAWSLAWRLADKDSLRPLSSVGVVTTGSTPSRKDAAYWDGDVPFATPGDLRHGRLIFEVSRSLTDAGASVSRLLPTDAVLVTCIGATIGKTSLMKGACVTNQQINAVVADPEVILPRFLLSAISSPLFQNAIRSASSGAATPIINKKSFSQLEIPVPSIAEQTDVVALGERILVMADDLESELAHARIQAETLQRTILRCAVRGLLVPQDPREANEPAISPSEARQVLKKKGRAAIVGR